MYHIDQKLQISRQVLILQRLDRSEHRSKRSAQLMAEDRQEPVLRRVRLLRVPERNLYLLVEPCIVDGDGGTSRDLLGEREVERRIVLLGFGDDEGDRTDRPLTYDQRNDHQRTVADLPEQLQFLFVPCRS